jgi:hypothetical protein
MTMSALPGALVYCSHDYRIYSVITGWCNDCTYGVFSVVSTWSSHPHAHCLAGKFYVYDTASGPPLYSAIQVHQEI